MRCRDRGFTLIELLVVVSIIALLISIVLPSFSKFRMMSKRTACMANLHSIAQALQSYLNENDDHWPYASSMISIEEAPNLHAISDVLMRGITAGREVFQCPADRITEQDPNRSGKTYFELEKTSYEWDTLGVFNGIKRGKSVLNLVAQLGPSDVPLMNDWECFHGGEGKPKSIVIMYADLSIRADDSPISKDEWPLPKE